MYKYKITRREGYNTKQFLTKYLGWDSENEQTHLLFENYDAVVEVVLAFNKNAPVGNPMTQIKYSADAVWVE